MEFCATPTSASNEPIALKELLSPPAEVLGLLFFFGRSTKVHSLACDEQSWHGGAISILHCTWRCRQKSQGRYLRDL